MSRFRVASWTLVEYRNGLRPAQSAEARATIAGAVLDLLRFALRGGAAQLTQLQKLRSRVRDPCWNRLFANTTTTLVEMAWGTAARVFAHHKNCREGDLETPKKRCS